MKRIYKYTQAQAEEALLKMFQNGLTAGDKTKLIKARKLPKNALNSYDLFKTYFLSGEGLPMVIKKLSQQEIIVLHILAFNQWIADVSVFEAIYKEMPKPSKYYWYRSGTYTQQYGAVLKAVQVNLVQKGLLVKYEDALGGDSKTERQRFIVPAAFATYLPSPFSDLRILEGAGSTNDENSRKNIQQAIQTSPKPTLDGITFNQGKLYLKKDFFSTASLEQIKFRQWQLAKGALILHNQYFEAGRTLKSFVLHYLKQLAPNQWFSEKSVTTLLAVWDDPKKRKELDIDKKYPTRYSTKGWCEAGWKAGLLEKQTKAGSHFYRLAVEQPTSTDFSQYLVVKPDGTLAVNLSSIPLTLLTILNQISFFQNDSSVSISAKPDLVHISSFPADILAHPLITWLKENAPTYKAAFQTFQKKYGKEIIHEQLLVAKITDLSLRVQVEKGLQKTGQVVVLSDEFIAFPIDALSLVERIVGKSGNVIKKVSS